MLPDGPTGRVRGLQVHGEATDQVGPGVRVAVNVQGVEHTDVHRGQVLARTGTVSVVSMFDGTFRALDRLEAFAALNGPTFYGLPLNKGKITLTRGERNPDPRFTVEDEEILPFFTDAGVNWIIADI